MDKKQALVLWFKDVNKDDVAIVGGKGANLGEMYNNGFPVPPGFLVTSNAYFKFIDDTGLREKIKDLLDNLNVDDTKTLQDVAEKIQHMIINTPVPNYISQEVKKAYLILRAGGDPTMDDKAIELIAQGRDPPYVAVRSSATAEDLPEASFAGQQATYLNVAGADNVVDAVRKCWASLFTARAIFYRAKNNFDHMKVGLCAVVQVMVNAEKAGVAFSVNPATNNEDEIVIEAAFGLGEAVVSGAVTPDLYIVDKKDMRIKSKTVSKKEFKIVRDIQTGKNVKVYLSDSQASSQVLSDEEIIKIASILRDIEKHYDFPQDTEWAIEGDKIYFVQSRPVTTLKSKKSSSVQTDKPPILKGLGASPGAASGPVKIVHDISELDKVKQGDVLVTRMTNPDMVPAMKKASAIVTDEGGMTSHAAIVSREMGIPCVVGTGEATKKLKEEQIVTVDGSAGLVYEGKVEVKSEEEEIPYYETKTKIYMNLGEPELIDKYKDLYFDGIGLMRVEFIITSYVKAHPLALIKQGKSDLYVEKLAEGIEKVAKAIYPKPVVVRFSDFKTNEYKSLEGGEEFEPVENNPMLGWRGVSRYISPNFEPAFRLECKAIKLVRDKGLDNVWVMLPFVRTLWEVEKVLKIIESEGLKRDDKFKVWIMAEVPAVAFLADKFADYCDGFSIGSNDLTQLVLGVDRDSELLGKAGYFDERNEAVKEAIKSIIDKAHSKGVTVSICGQAPSVYPEFTEFLVKHGVDSVSVSPDMVNKTRKRIHEIESSQ